MSREASIERSPEPAETPERQAGAGEAPGIGEAEPPPAGDTANVTGVAPEVASQDAGEPEAAAPPLSLEELQAIVEALLYASSEPLTVKELKKALPEVSPEAVTQALGALLEQYQAPGRGLHIMEVAGGYQIATRPEYHDRVGRLIEAKPPSKLSIQALETLAAIAYRQPITVPEIMALRGVRSASVVRTLLERKLIRILGRKNVVGRPLLYGTTKEFLLRFGLKDLGELPRLRDMAEVFGEETVAHLEDMVGAPSPAASEPEDKPSAGAEAQKEEPSAGG